MWAACTAFRKRKLLRLILEKKKEREKLPESILWSQSLRAYLFFLLCLRWSLGAYGGLGCETMQQHKTSLNCSSCGFSHCDNKRCLMNESGSVLPKGLSISLRALMMTHMFCGIPRIDLCILLSTGDRSQVSSADRQDSDGDDSDGPDDEENDDNEEEEEDSQAESGLSTNPSVSASPQHISSKEAEVPPSALLAQMSISSVSLPPSQPPAPESHTSVPMMSPMSLSKQIFISGSCYSPVPLPYCPPAVATTSDSYTSDTESVHMMSPVSPCRQMSIDYPDFDVPPSPPVPGKGSKLGQVRPIYSHCVSLHHSLPASFLSYPYPYFESCMQGTSTKLL